MIQFSYGFLCCASLVLMWVLLDLREKYAQEQYSYKSALASTAAVVMALASIILFSFGFSG